MDLVIDFSLLVGLTTAVVEGLKRTIGDGFSRFAFLASVVVGVGLSIGSFGLNREAAFVGLIIGMTASGLYSGTKSSLGY